MSISTVSDAIIARLEAQLQAIDVPLVRKVYTHRDYAALPETAMVTPSLAVIYNGYHLGASISPTGAIREVAWDFLVVVNVRNARNADTGEGVQEDAAVLVDAVLGALLGWKPEAKQKPLQLESAPGAALNDAGFGYFPIAFSTLATYRGTT